VALSCGPSTLVVSIIRVFKPFCLFFQISNWHLLAGLSNDDGTLLIDYFRGTELTLHFTDSTRPNL